VVGQPVVPTEPAVDRLLTVDLDQALVAEPVERRIQRAGGEAHAVG
jgi:hypothetical protein